MDKMEPERTARMFVLRVPADSASMEGGSQ